MCKHITHVNLHHPHMHKIFRYHHFENILSRSQKVKELTYDPEILLLGGILPKRNENIVLINVNRIINGQNWKQLKFP